MKDPSRRYRWLLLFSSLLTIAYLVAAAAHENYFAEWQRIQRRYREILRARATDDTGRALARDFRIEPKQVSVPALKVVDRCVTCHNGIDDPRMTDVPLPHAVHPGKILEHHPADRFGCTVCHHGQGAATNFHDAKATDVAWDYPLLDRNLTQSSCRTCHDISRLPSHEISLELEGRELYARKGCGSCHKLGGRGGTLGPALDDEGAKTRHQLVLTNMDPPYTTWRWHEAHFRDPAGMVPGSRMKNPTVSDHEALALTVYMLSLRRSDVPESYLAPDKIAEKFHELHPEPLGGEEVYRRYCASCHGDGTYGRWDKTFGRFVPAVRGPSLQATAGRAYLESQIAKGRPGTQMPAWEKDAGGLMDSEIEAVAAYIQSPPAGKPEPIAPQEARIPAEGDPGRGDHLFNAYCAGCHGAAGRGGVAPEVGNPSFLQAASDELIVTTIRNGRLRTAMPSFQPRAAGALSLNDTDLGDLLAYLRSLGPRPPGGTNRAGAVADRASMTSGGASP
ncbi:MAG TPA: c-type cytochrome [Candidatus Saccharimonadales bacterium]|nr:c-type cytochrome [Candidatus Saccharimonadales bacterium]